MLNNKRFAPIAAVAALTMALTGCGGSTGGGGGAGSDEGPAAENLDARGPITYVRGKDNSDVVRPLIKKWNEAHPDQKVTFKEQSDTADQQHDDLVQNLQAKNADYDIMEVDVVWTAEFAAKGWLQPLEGDMAIETEDMLDATVETGMYNDVLYTAPQRSDGGLLYYRKDLVPKAPGTWDEMMGMCDIAEENDMGCYAGQFAQYEGLTVNVAEAINTAGGTIIDEEGNPTLETPEAKAGLGNLVEGFESGNIPEQAITFQEEESRQAFQSGNLLFLRNWPYVYNLAKTEASSKVQGKFGVAPLPGKDGPGASSLGGHNLGISVYSDHKATAHDFMEYMISAESQTFRATQGSQAPTLAALYDDPELIKQLPYLPVLKTSIENAVPRPVTPFYPGVSKAIQENSYAALQGEKSVDQALADMQQAIKSAAAGS
ncbi:ABC transporter substrate-binding protein [Arthrobacter sp. H14]|uniref:ABC transporter substrate-binding protein n=1 Tax=Arthrobacter sp. H14 TaxID=1312959 RepID=UPI0004B6D608|nr:ABC transporter substrate-binding protein [Arthrobacter sp. H14]